MRKKLFFLCNFAENLCFVLGVKVEEGDWHYFEDEDTLIGAHGSLPAELEDLIKQLQTMKPIPISLDANELLPYMINDKFVFKGKELKTFVQVSSNRSDHVQNRRKGSNTDDLVFIAGETNPLVFLSDFEKCNDVRAEKDKLYKIRKFVNDEHKSQFSTFFYKGQWEAARSSFLKKYSYIYTQNKKNALDFQFSKETGLWSFVHRKIIALSTYTTLTLNNQMEVILAELPIEISNLFILHLKMNATKSEILEFCTSIQETADGGLSSGNTTPTPQSQQQQQNDIAQDMEMFSYHSSDAQSDVESSEGPSSSSVVSRKRGIGNTTRRRGRPPKITKDTDADSEGSRSSTSSFSCI